MKEINSERKRLNTDELQALKQFIQKRGFKEVDLQYEILDHLACQVEEKMDNKGLSFDDALIEAHNDFGVFGFSVIEDSLRKALQKQNNQEAWRELKLWASFPRILFVYGIGVFLFKLSTRLPLDWILYGTSILYFLAQALVLVLSYRSMKKFRNTMINQSTLVYNVVLPVVLFQILIRAPFLLNTITEFWKPILLPFILAALAFVLIFLVAASYRVFKYALERCAVFEKQYGPL